MPFQLQVMCRFQIGWISFKPEVINMLIKEKSWQERLLWWTNRTAESRLSFSAG